MKRKFENVLKHYKNPFYENHLFSSVGKYDTSFQDNFLVWFTCQKIMIQLDFNAEKDQSPNKLLNKENYEG